MVQYSVVLLDPLSQEVFFRSQGRGGGGGTISGGVAAVVRSLLPNPEVPGLILGLVEGNLLSH